MKKAFLLVFTCILWSSFSNNVIAQGCGSNIIYVDLELLKDENLDIVKWKNKYPETVVCNVVGDVITVDLGAFTDLKQVPKWLRENSGFINFRKSYPLIESIHRIPAGDPAIALAEANIASGDKKTYDYDDMIIFFDSNITIDKLAPSEYYKNYKLIKRDIFGKVKVNVVDEFVDGEFCFSAPLLKSIIRKNLINAADIKAEYKNCFFTFTIIEQVDASGDKIEKAVMKFTYDGTSSFYDFSDEPGRASFLKTPKNQDIIKRSL